MINFFIENNILMIVLLSLFIITELVIFKATEDNYASQRKTQRISATIVTVMIFYAMYIIPTTLVEKHIEHLNVDDTDGDVVKVTKEKYPKLWKFLKSYLKNNITN